MRRQLIKKNENAAVTTVNLGKYNSHILPKQVSYVENQIEIFTDFQRANRLPDIQMQAKILNCMLDNEH